MRTKILITMFIAATALILASCNEHNDLYKNGLNGKVKSYNENMYVVEKSDNNWVKGNALKDVTVKMIFDESGYYNSIEAFGSDNKSLGKWKAVYEDGILIKQVKYDSEDNILQTNSYKQKSSEIQECEIHMAGLDKIVTKSTFYYENDLLVMVVNIDQGDGDSTVMVYTYDEDRRKISETETYNGEIKSEENYEFLEFDDKGNWTKKLIYKNDQDGPEYMVLRIYEYY